MTFRRRPIHVIKVVKETRGADADLRAQAPTRDGTPYQEGSLLEALDVAGESAKVFPGKRYQLSAESPRHSPTVIAAEISISIVNALKREHTYHAILSLLSVAECVGSD